MSVDEKESTAFGFECGPVQEERSSNGAEPRGVVVSPPSHPGRLRGRANFERLYRGGSRGRSGGLTVLSVLAPTGMARVTEGAGRIVGGAVRRNRAKRRIRQAWRHVPLSADRDYLAVASAAVNEVEFARLVEWLRRAVERSIGE